MSIPITAPYYPIVYVRGFAPLQSTRAATFYDAYYGFADTAVDKHETHPTVNSNPEDNKPQFALDIFEGQLVRFMKEHGYVDAYNDGLKPLRPGHDPTRSLWICRFYDRDFIEGRVRPIEDHAQELLQMVTRDIPQGLADNGVQVFNEDGVTLRPDYKVILLAHSMGGLVCRTLIQNLFPNQGQRAEDWIHRFVTIATPNGGIDFGNVPDLLEQTIGSALNPLDGAMFQPARMRAYLNLPDGTALNSLNGTFPAERCLSLIGSDYRSYREDIGGAATQALTGNRSDGLVKQDNAFIDGAYTANVHRAHSGTHGIVNSAESYANIQRFLFGDVKVGIALTDLQVIRTGDVQADDFYDVDFRISIRNTGVYLHQRRQDPCENGWVFTLGAVPQLLPLHTGFLNSKLRPDPSDPYLHFLLSLRIVEHRPRGLWPWDREYPERVIFSETLELRVTLTPDAGEPPLQYRWLSDSVQTDDNWQKDLRPQADGSYLLPLRAAATFTANYRFEPTDWPGQTHRN